MAIEIPIEMPAEFIQAMDDARESALRFAEARQEILEQEGKSSKALKEEVRQLERLEKERRRGLQTFERTVARMVDLENQHVANAKAADLQSKAVDQNLNKALDQHRRYVANAGRSLSMLVDELKDTIRSTGDAKVALAELDATTSAADKETQEYTDRVAALKATMKLLRVEEMKAKNEREKATEGFEQAKKRADAYETALDSLNVPFSGLIMKAKELNDAFETAAEVGGDAEVANLKGAIAIGAVASAAAAGVASVLAIGAGLTALAASASETNKELEPLGLGLSRGLKGQADDARASVDVLGTSLKAAGATLGATWAPVLTESNVQLTALTLAATDAFNVFMQGKDITTALSEVLSVGLVGTVSAAISPIKNLAIAGGLLFDTLGVTDSAAIDLKNSFDELTESLEDSTATGLRQMVRLGLEPLNEVTGKYDEKARTLIATQRGLNAAMDDGGETSKRLAAEYQALLDEADALEFFEQERLDRLNELGDVDIVADADFGPVTEGLEFLNEKQATVFESMRQQAILMKNDLGNAASAAFQLGRTLADAIGKGAEEGSRRARAAAITNILISSAEAAIKSFATLGPPIPPNIPGILGAAAVAAQTVASLRAVGGAGGGGGGNTGGYTSSPTVETSRTTNTGPQTNVVPVTDAAFPSYALPGSVAPTNGDVLMAGSGGFVATRGGANNLFTQDTALLDELRASRAASEKMAQAFTQLASTLLQQQHFAVANARPGSGTK